MRNVLFVVFLISALCNINLAAQAERYTEEEIMLQDKFIAAHSEKMLGKVDKAITLFKEVHKADRQNATVAFELARAYSIKEDNESTKKYIELACRNDKDNLYFQQFRAEFYEKTNDIPATLNALDKLISLEPFNESNFYKAGELYEQSGNTDQAVATYNRLEGIIGINEQTRRRKFEIYNRTGAKKKAISELVGLTNTYPSSTRFLNNLASYYKEIGENKSSEKTYKKVLSIDPSNPDATIALAGDITKPGNEAAYLIALKGIIGSPEIDIDTKIKELIPYVQNMSTEATDPENISLINSIEDLQNAHPREAKAYAIYGDVLMNVGKTNEAIEKYAKTIELNKSNYAVWEQYMYALESESRFEELVTVSNQALDLYPNQAMCYYFNGAGNLKTGDKKEADSMFEEALLIGRKNTSLKQRIENLKSSGSITVNLKDNFRQWAFMRGYKAPYSSKIYEEFGDELLKEGDSESALEYWEEGSQRDIKQTSIRRKNIIAQSKVIKVNKPIYLLYLLCAIGFALGSCKAKKIGSTNIKSEKELRQSLELHNHDFEWFSAKGSLKYKNVDGSGKATINVRMKKDSIIWLNIKKFSIEISRVKMTPDSVFIVYRWEKLYEKGRLDQFTRAYNTNFDFAELQDLFFGNVTTTENINFVSQDSSNII